MDSLKTMKLTKGAEVCLFSDLGTVGTVIGTDGDLTVIDFGTVFGTVQRVQVSGASLRPDGVLVLSVE